MAQNVKDRNSDKMQKEDTARYMQCPLKFISL